MGLCHPVSFLIDRRPVSDYSVLRTSFLSEGKNLLSGYDEARKSVMDGLLVGMPGVKASKAFGYPAYKVNGKIFAFVGSKVVAIKLPKMRVQELTDAHPEMKPFEVDEGVIWREWLAIDRPDSEDYAQDIELFEESVQFVAG
jgi:hypothetical protein